MILRHRCFRCILRGLPQRRCRPWLARRADDVARRGRRSWNGSTIGRRKLHSGTAGRRVEPQASVARGVVVGENQATRNLPSNTRATLLGAWADTQTQARASATTKNICHFCEMFALFCQRQHVFAIFQQPSLFVRSWPFSVAPQGSTVRVLGADTAVTCNVPTGNGDEEQTLRVALLLPVQKARSIVRSDALRGRHKSSHHHAAAEPLIVCSNVSDADSGMGHLKCFPRQMGHLSDHVSFGV